MRARNPLLLGRLGEPSENEDREIGYDLPFSLPPFPPPPPSPSQESEYEANPLSTFLLPLSFLSIHPTRPSLPPIGSPSSPIVGRTMSFADSEMKKPNGTSHKQIKKNDNTWNVYAQIRTSYHVYIQREFISSLASTLTVTLHVSWVVTIIHSL